MSGPRGRARARTKRPSCFCTTSTTTINRTSGRLRASWARLCSSASRCSSRTARATTTSSGTTITWLPLCARWGHAPTALGWRSMAWRRGSAQSIPSVYSRQSAASLRVSTLPCSPTGGTNTSPCPRQSICSTSSLCSTKSSDSHRVRRCCTVTLTQSEPSRTQQC
eukprot:Amastigsp_a339888_50.p2 type:complete len:166 gc:universal Amastigsp_a339888_50:623-126(-)